MLTQPCKSPSSLKSPSRRQFLAGLAAATGALSLTQCGSAQVKKPNILFAISDDQSWLHTSISGDPVVQTPSFDRVAKAGVLFTNAVTNSPGCAPSRAAILTGRSHWQLREAGTHASYFPRDLKVYTELLKDAGYHVGATGKGAGPANFEGSGWEHNPAGLPYSERKLAEPMQYMNPLDYAGNFEDFLAAKQDDQPFCFWFGASEPHRPFKEGIGKAAGKRVEDVKVPEFLPDVEVVRSDMLDYYQEIEHFDDHLGRMLDTLEERGELENTLVVVTSDNGMAFPGAKAQMVEYGIHMPLAMMWPAQCPAGRRVEDMVTFTDFAPTFLEAADVAIPEEATGKSLLPVLRSTESGQVDASRVYGVSGRERHSHSRADNLGYPARALRSREYLYVRNFAPERHPAGDPPNYHDIDACPTLSFLLENQEHEKVKPLFENIFGKNPAEQLFDIVKDPACMNNLTGQAEHEAIRAEMAKALEDLLREQQDPRILGTGDIFESYPRHSPMRPQLGGFAERGEYNPKYRQ